MTAPPAHHSAIDKRYTVRPFNIRISNALARHDTQRPAWARLHIPTGPLHTRPPRGSRHAGQTRGRLGACPGHRLASATRRDHARTSRHCPSAHYRIQTDTAASSDWKHQGGMGGAWPRAHRRCAWRVTTFPAGARGYRIKPYGQASARRAVAPPAASPSP